MLAVYVLLGAVATAGALRVRAHRGTRELRQRERAGSILWGATAREVAPTGRLRHSGALVVAGDRILRFEPGASSRKRGAEVREWRAGDVRVEIGPRRWDIAGVRYRVVTVTPSFGEDPVRYACVAIRGQDFPLAGVGPAPGAGRTPR
ncbi:MAG: hypothetical protein FWE71_02970 [Nocardioidaceae bacterium]|nr:hypothetical protein [Nocardioidaceae bacterium]MCL2615024.1 hypothetical protein [Nocardioidaceae bacterium]